MKLDHNILKKYVEDSTICCEKHPFADLYIYGYYSDSGRKIIWDDINKYCRGIILDGEGNIIERPFNKFWTFQQYISNNLILLNDCQILRLPEGDFRITEKVDGTMVTLYWLHNTPYLATQRSFTNVKAIEATKILHEKYSHLYSVFNRNYTYVFEAIYPETRVLIDYGDMRDLILIGVIDKETGIPLPVPDIGFRTCRDYSHQYGHIKDFNDLCDLDLNNQEGFVIYYESGETIKLKFPWYVKAHSLLDQFMKHERFSYRWYKELAMIRQQTMPIVREKELLDSLDKGDTTFHHIRASVPPFFYLMGFDYWLHMMKDRITKHIEPIFPQPQYFDFEERMKTPHIFETSIWKWEERFLKGKDA